MSVSLLERAGGSPSEVLSEVQVQRQEEEAGFHSITSDKVFQSVPL